jgi:hypothetical protein
MPDGHLNPANADLKRVVSNLEGTIMKPRKRIAGLAKIVTELPKAIATSLKIALIAVFAVALLWMSLPIEASPVGTGSSGMGTFDFSGLTLRCELEAGAVFTSLIPGPEANWGLSLLGNCVWQVNPAVTIVGRGCIIGSLPCLSTNPGHTMESTVPTGASTNSISTPANAQSHDKGHVELSLDRLFLQYESGRARAVIGKQSVNWGPATVFRPTDLITPRDPGGSGEGRPGKVLATLFWRTSPLTGVELVLGEDLYAGRAEFRIGRTNLGILGLTQRGGPTGNRNSAGSRSRGAAGNDNSVRLGNGTSITNLTASWIENAVGLDFQGGLKGFYGEICHRWTDMGAQSFDMVHPGAHAEISTTSGTIGWKTILHGGNLVFAEYCRNHVQLGSISAVTQLAAAGTTYQYDEFTTFGLLCATDLTGGTWTATGTLTSLLTENLDLNCRLSITKGPYAQAQVMLKWYL